MNIITSHIDSVTVIKLCETNRLYALNASEGTITGEHGIGLQKKEYLLKEHSDNIPLMKLIKKSFDPNNILNPGKIFDI